MSRDVSQMQKNKYQAFVHVLEFFIDIKIYVCTWHESGKETGRGGNTVGWERGLKGGPGEYGQVYT